MAESGRPPAAGAPEAMPDAFDEDVRLDFRRPFLPDSLARTDALTPRARLALNQIRAHGYLDLCGLFDRAVLPFAIGQRRRLSSDADRSVLLLRTASEQVKHVQLVSRFQEEFTRDFPARCETVRPSAAVISEILSHEPLAVMLVLVHFEWLTQAHWHEVAADPGLDLRFATLVASSAAERSRHILLDTVVVEALAAGGREDDVVRAVSGYLDIVGVLDKSLELQPHMDLAALEAATGGRLDDDQRRSVLAGQRQAIRWTFFGSALAVPSFVRTLERLAPAARELVDEVTPLYS